MRRRASLASCPEVDYVQRAFYECEVTTPHTHLLYFYYIEATFLDTLLKVFFVIFELHFYNFVLWLNSKMEPFD